MHAIYKHFISSHKIFVSFGFVCYLWCDVSCTVVSAENFPEIRIIIHKKNRPPFLLKLVMTTANANNINDEIKKKKADILKTEQHSGDTQSSGITLTCPIIQIAISLHLYREEGE